MAVEGVSTPPTEVAVGDSPRRVSETPLSPTVPGSGYPKSTGYYISDEADLLFAILNVLRDIRSKL